jgi:hypothetical protein
VANNVCSGGSIVDLGPIWYSYCADLVDYKQDETNPDATILTPSREKQVKTISFKNDPLMKDVKTFKILSDPKDQYLEIHMKDLPDNLRVYGYATENIFNASTANMINKKFPLVNDAHYNVSAAAGFLLVAYPITDDPVSFTFDFKTTKDVLGLIADYKDNPIIVLCIILMTLTGLTILILVYMKCVKKYNARKKDEEK